MKSIKLVFVSALLVLAVGCQSLSGGNSTQVIFDKLALVSSITTLKDSYIRTKDLVSDELTVFSEAEVDSLKADVEVIESFYRSLSAITSAESSASVAVNLGTLTSQINSIRPTISNAASIVAFNQDELSDEARAEFVALVGKYNVISDELDRQLAIGDTQAIADNSLALLEVAVPLILKVIAAAA